MSELNNTMTINLGPQHPSTHGVLRLILNLEGEYIQSCEPVVGYLHRGLEKMAENRSYLQYLPLVDRVDYLGGFFNSYAYLGAVENLLNIEVPEKAQYIRVLCMELNRISSHLLWLGTYLLDLGATSPLFYSFRDRECILRFFEDLTGQRMMYNYFTFSGVKYDLPKDWLLKVKDYVQYLPNKIKDYEDLISENPIFLERTKNKGVLSKNLALDYSITGPNLRASSSTFDLRKDCSYLIYDKLNFEVPTQITGDSYSRYLVRVEEMKESLNLISQCCEKLLSDNSVNVKLNINPINLKLPEGEVTSSVESPRGICSCYLKSDGSNKPYRVKWRTGSFYAVQILPELVKNMQLCDLMAIFGSLDVILPEVDR